MGWLCVLFRMKPNDIRKDMVNYNPNLLVRPYEFGSVNGVRYVDKTIQHFTYVYKFLIQFLVNSLGYKKNVDIFGAPYDFRSVSSESTQQLQQLLRRCLAKYEMKRYFSNLDGLVQLSYNIHRRPCILISHSLGGLLMSEYLHSRSPSWKSHYIDSWISMSGAFGGAVKALKNILTGISLDNPLITYNNEIIKAAIRTFPTAYYLLPNHLAFSEKHVEILVID